MAKKKVTPVVDSSVTVAAEVALSINTEVLEAAEEALTATTEALAVVETVQASVATSKASIARIIFNEMNAAGPLVRKDILARFVSEAGLTEKGANTYYNNFRKAAGLVAPKVKAEVEVPADGAETTASA